MFREFRVFSLFWLIRWSKNAFGNTLQPRTSELCPFILSVVMKDRWRSIWYQLRKNLSPRSFHFRKWILKKHLLERSFPNTMNSFPRLLGSLPRNDAAWTCSSCAKAIRRKPYPFFKPSRSMKRDISNSTKTRQNVAPTMEQLRAPFQKKNSSTLYYTLSIILGTVAFSYGSVPMYKMVRLPHPTSSFNS